MSSASQVTRLRHDEILYSGIARASAYLGSPPRARLHDALLGADVSVFDDLPVGLGRVVASGAFGPADVDGAIHEWTMFPFYAHHADAARIAKTAMRMEGEGEWPHEALGCQLAAPDRLRFCASCRADMLEQWPDAWWRRTHQMPSALVCPDHCEPLLASRVTRDRRRGGYVAATDVECPPDAPVVAVIDGGVAMADLVLLARASDALLDERPDGDPVARRRIYIERMGPLGMLNRHGDAKLPAVAEAVEMRWGPTLGLWPGLTRAGRCSQAWLAAIMTGGHGGAPLHHLLLEGTLGLSERWR